MMFYVCCLLLYKQENRTELSTYWAEQLHFPALWKAASVKPEPKSTGAIVQMQNNNFHFPAFHFVSEKLETVYSSLWMKNVA